MVQPPFAVGKGGPLLNVTMYPTGALVFGPYVVALGVAGRLPPEMFSAASPTSARFVVVALGISMPGFFLSLAFLALFLGVKTYVLGTHEAWGETHMPEEWQIFKTAFDTWERSQ